MTHHVKTEDAAPYGAAPTRAPDPAPNCRWSFDAIDGYWATACGNAYVFNDGGPPENNFSFCPFCGQRLLTDRSAPKHIDDAPASTGC